jgi:hypothetical protein
VRNHADESNGDSHGYGEERVFHLTSPYFFSCLELFSVFTRQFTDKALHRICGLEPIMRKQSSNCLASGLKGISKNSQESRETGKQLK